jgi:hypothetical protein
MKHRIAIWAGVGFLVAGCWALYFFAAGPIPYSSTEPILWTLVDLTCPVAFASLHFHFGIYFYWVLLANAATYALIGLIVETLRKQLSHAS